MSHSRPVKVPKRQDPIVRFIFQQVNKRQLSLAYLSKRTGIDQSTFRKWRNEGRNVTLESAQLCLEVLGYTLEITNAEDTEDANSGRDSNQDDEGGD